MSAIEKEKKKWLAMWRGLNEVTDFGRIAVLSSSALIESTTMADASNDVVSRRAHLMDTDTSELGSRLQNGGHQNAKRSLAWPERSEGNSAPPIRGKPRRNPLVFCKPRFGAMRCREFKSHRVSPSRLAEYLLRHPFSLQKSPGTPLPRPSSTDPNATTLPSATSRFSKPPISSPPSSTTSRRNPSTPSVTTVSILTKAGA